MLVERYDRKGWRYAAILTVSIVRGQCVGFIAWKLGFRDPIAGVGGANEHVNEFFALVTTFVFFMVVIRRLQRRDELETKPRSLHPHVQRNPNTKRRKK